MRPSSGPGAGIRSRRADGVWLARTLAGMAASLRREHLTTAGSLAIITETAATVLPGADGAAVVVPAPDGTLDTRTAYGALPRAVVALQNEIGQGPCLDALTWAAPIRIPDIRDEGRWPLFSGPAAAIGALSMVCRPMMAGPAVIGSLCLISETAGAFDDQAGDLTAVFAEHAAIALAGDEALRPLQEALSTRNMIEQATGIIMERYGMTPDTAFAVLARVSQHTNVKLRDVAEELCRTGALPQASRTRQPASGLAPGRRRTLS